MEAKEHAETKERQRASKPARVNYPYEFTVLKLLKKKKKKKSEFISNVVEVRRKKKKAIPTETFKRLLCSARARLCSLSARTASVRFLCLFIFQKKKGKNRMIKRSEEQLPAGVSIRAL